jgi:hypothetical protein
MLLEIGVLIALVVGLTEVGKKLGIPSRFLPLLALLLGVGVNFVLKFLGIEYGELLLGGLVAGLSAIGLYSGTKATLEK